MKAELIDIEKYAIKVQFFFDETYIIAVYIWSKHSLTECDVTLSEIQIDN